MPVCNKCKKHSNCLTIDPCDHCGAKDWDEKTVLPSKASRASQTAESFGCLLTLGILVAIGLCICYFLFVPDNVQLAIKYHTPVERVNVLPKPHGCGFTDAPLGNKHCHYGEYVYVYDRNGQVIEINGKRQPCPDGCGPAYSVKQVFVKVED